MSINFKFWVARVLLQILLNTSQTAKQLERVKEYTEALEALAGNGEL